MIHTAPARVHDPPRFIEVRDNPTAGVLPSPAMTEVWVRNPELCIRECLEAGVDKIVFHRGFLASHRIDPVKFMSLHYGTSPYRCLLVGNAEQGTVEFTETGPKAVYPTWEYGQNLSLLEEMMANPPENYEHRIVITDTPMAHTGIGRKFFQVLRELQGDYQDCILHIHGLYSFRVMFGLGYGSVDTEPRTLAKKGRVTLPNGKEVTFERAAEEPQWVTLLGLQPSDLRVPRMRCIYNILSAGWASQHFLDNVKFKHKGFTHIDPDDPTKRVTQNARTFTRNKLPVQEGDKFLCTACSLQSSCKYYRDGAVCAVPDTEPQELHAMFGTRDADTIINGLNTLLTMESRRYVKAVDAEDIEEDGLDGETTKLAKNLFDAGTKLAKLINPNLENPQRPGHISFTQINTGGATPASAMAAVFAELENRGVPREQITKELVMNLLSVPEEKRTHAIEAAAVEVKSA